MDKDRKEYIIRLIKKEVVPAIGCTEPAAVALAVAKATETLGRMPERIELNLSGNIIKNAMGVGIPGTGMIGLPIAVALGALVGKSEYGLEVLRDVDEENLERGKRFIAEKRIFINHASDASSNLYIEVKAYAGNDCSETIISGSHRNFVRIALNGSVLFEKEEEKGDGSKDDAEELTAAEVYGFAVETPLDDIRFILQAGELNKSAAELAFNGTYGHSLGKTIKEFGKPLFGDSPIGRIVCLTSAACDARMGGAPVAVMSNSGSGNQGITATLPVVCYADEIGASEEQKVRALVLSNLTSIYIKQSLGALSALCGCVVASTGASAGLVYLMGGGFNEVCSAIKNMIANLTGMICDGAKPSCSMKISSGVYTAAMSAMLAMNGKCVTSAEGIVCDDIDTTIHNLTSIGREAMAETDRHVLRIMISK